MLQFDEKTLALFKMIDTKNFDWKSRKTWSFTDIIPKIMKHGRNDKFMKNHEKMASGSPVCQIKKKKTKEEILSNTGFKWCTYRQKSIYRTLPAEMGVQKLCSNIWNFRYSWKDFQKMQLVIENFVFLILMRR